MGFIDDDETWSCEAEAIAETPKALKVKLEDGDVKWIPKSVIHDDSEVYDADENKAGKLVLKMWWASEEGLA